MNKNLKKYMFLSMIGLGALACESKLGEEIKPEVEIPMPQTTELFISEYACSSTKDTNGFRNTYFELYNNTGKDIDLSKYTIAYRSNSNPWTDEQPLAGVLQNGATFVIARGGDGVNPTFIKADMVWDALTANGDDAIRLSKEGTAIDFVGETEDPGTAWAVAGIEGATRDLVLWRKQAILEGTTDWAISAGTTTENSQWVVSAVKEAYENSGKATVDVTEYVPGDVTPEPEPEPEPTDSDLFFSEFSWISGSNANDSEGFRNTYIEIYNPTSESVDLSQYALRYAKNSDGWGTEESILTGMLAPQAVIVIGRGEEPLVNPTKIVTDFVWATMQPNGDDGIQLMKNIDGKFIAIDNIGDDTDPGTAYDVAGITDATRDRVFWRKNTITKGNTNWATSAGTTAEDSEWMVSNIKEDYANAGEATGEYVAQPNPDEPENPAPTEGDVFISEFACAAEADVNGFRNTYIELYNPTVEAIDLTKYSMKYAKNGAAWAYELPLTGTLAAGETYLIVRDGVNTEIFTGDIVWSDLKPSGDDGVQLLKEGVALDQVGEAADLTTDGFPVAGIENATVSRVLWRKASINKGNTNWTTSAGTTAEDSEWIVSETKEEYGNVGLPTAN